MKAKLEQEEYGKTAPTEMVPRTTIGGKTKNMFLMNNRNVSQKHFEFQNNRLFFIRSIKKI